MAKATTKKTADVKPATTDTATAAPAQPWAAKQEAAPAPAETTIDPGPATSEDAKPEGEVSSEAKDQVTPSGENPSEAVNEQLGDGAEGNGGGVDSAAEDEAEEDADDEAESLTDRDENAPETETTSIERDQVTPSGDNPSIKAAVDQSRLMGSLVNEDGSPATDLVKAPPPPEEVPAEVRDQVTPVGEDVALSMDDQRKVSIANSAFPTPNELLASRMAALSKEDQAELMDQINDLAMDALDRMERNAKAREMAASMVTGTKVYGNNARRPNHDETLGGLNNNVQLNRRARRAAERLQRAEQAAKSAKQ